MTGPRINPEDYGVSGTFSALERTTEGTPPNNRGGAGATNHVPEGGQMLRASGVPSLQSGATPPPPPSPFDAGRIPCPQGGEDRWSARWLMGQMGYPTWQHFEPVIERAKTAAHNEGFNVRTLFTVNRENSGGRPRIDYSVTRYAAYLIAMNGDPRKPECSAAQHYFAVKTRLLRSQPLEFAERDYRHARRTVLRSITGGAA